MLIKNLIMRLVMPVADIVMSPLTFVFACQMKVIRRLSLQNMPVSRSIFQSLGMLPVTTHYYDPMIVPNMLNHPLDQVRKLPGIDLNMTAQLERLCGYGYQSELMAIPLDDQGDGQFYYRNGAFGAGDGEILYSVIRHSKPKMLIEIGGGFSTLMAQKAIVQNIVEDESYTCRHICIEPYEYQWLDKLDVEVIRERVEDVDASLFSQLGQDDILFIDSSHMIRVQGDVLVEYLEILPTLNSGVMVHIHDIFTPRDYPSRWVFEAMLLWNEQYLLEAFISQNENYEVMLSLNHLFHDHKDALNLACPVLNSESGPEPGSFWIIRP